MTCSFPTMILPMSTQQTNFLGVLRILVGLESGYVDLAAFFFVRIKNSLKLFRIYLNNFFNPYCLLIFRPNMQNEAHINQKPKVRSILVLALVFMLLGTALELYLLHHFESVQQAIPLIFIGALLLLVALSFFSWAHGVFQFFKPVLLLTALSGLYGTFLHLKANYEFELEMKPTANNWDLFLESMSGALPALAPCSMIVLALIGYSYTLLLNTNDNEKT